MLSKRLKIESQPRAGRVEPEPINSLCFPMANQGCASNDKFNKCIYNRNVYCFSLPLIQGVCDGGALQKIGLIFATKDNTIYCNC